MEGGAVGAAALGYARMRPRRRSPRVRREALDLTQLAAELGDPLLDAGAPTTEQEILQALEAEVAARAQSPAAPEVEVVEAVPDVERESVEVVEPEPVEPEPVEPEPVEVEPVPVKRAEIEAAPLAVPAATAPTVGLPPEQIRAWLERVKEDLRRIETRVQYLQVEQARLESQHRLVAELITSTTPV